MTHRWIAGLALLLAIAFGTACSATDTQMERWAGLFTQPAIEVGAEQLYREYVRDEETAADIYEGRRVRLTGTVYAVADDDDFEPTVEFNVGQDEWTFTTLVAHFAEGHRSAVDAWSIGAVISAVCYVPIEDFAPIDFDSVVPLKMCQPL